MSNGQTTTHHKMGQKELGAIHEGIDSQLHMLLDEKLLGKIRGRVGENMLL